jgi:hypothetical protein
MPSSSNGGTMLAYPDSFPLAEGLNVVTIFRKGEMKAKAAVLAHDLWVLQGYAQKAVIGDPNAPVDAPTDEPKEPDFSIFSEEDPVAALQKVCDLHSGDAAAQGLIPWKTILKWALKELALLAF